MIPTVSSKNLTANGFTVPQAEALANEQIRLLGANLATKADLAAVKSDLEVKIETVRADLEVKIGQVRASIETTRAELQRDIEKARADFSNWMLAGWVTQTGVIAALFWYFFPGLPGG